MKRLTLLLALLSACSPDASSGPADAPKPDTEAPAPPPRPSVPVIAFDAPSGWIKEEPANNMRKAQYQVPDRKKEAKDAAFTLSTTRGWTQDDFDRWSAQMGGATPKVERFEGKCKVTLVDLTGTYRSDIDPTPIENARMLIGIVDTADRPWFFKLVGPTETVSGWYDDFLAMVKAAHP
jgi:hypothetical protein